MFDLYRGDANTRYWLGKNGARKIYVIGLNPSTADCEKLDQTMRRIFRFMADWNRNGFVMLNLYPQRATTPSNLPRVPDQNLARRNMDSICEQIGSTTKPEIWAAWGDSITSRNFLWQCLDQIVTELKRKDCIWKHCGEPTVKGHPRHPSRLKVSCSLREFDIHTYLKSRRIPQS